MLKLSESLAGEVLGTGVTVTCVCPGRTKTGFGEGAGAGKDFYDDKPHDSPEQVAAATLEAFQQRRVFIVTGPQQWFMSKLPRLLSRQRAISLMAGVSKKLYA